MAERAKFDAEALFRKLRGACLCEPEPNDAAWECRVCAGRILQAAHAAGRREALQEAAAILDGQGAPDYIRGCSDGNCVIVRPNGMHTNGGCKCGIQGPTVTRAEVRPLRAKLEWTRQQIRALIEVKP